MTKITYVVGDATYPADCGSAIIAHVCNDVGAWGRGFVLALSKRWSEPELSYRRLAKFPLALGSVQFVTVTQDITVANMIAQHDIKYKDHMPPIRYTALEECLDKVSKYAHLVHASVHMPRIGCGLAGGEWYMVQDIIESTLCKRNLVVFVYDFFTRKG